MIANIIILFLFFNFIKVLNTIFAFFKSRFPVGSSAKIILGSLIIALAIATL